MKDMTYDERREKARELLTILSTWGMTAEDARTIGAMIMTMAASAGEAEFQALRRGAHIAPADDAANTN